MLELRLCGGVEVEVDGRALPESLIGGRQGRLVLAYLACERERTVRREELADLLWASELPESWTASLSAVISRLRRLFTEAGLDGSSVVVSSPGAYQLDLPAGTRIDLEDLVAAVDEAEEAAAGGDTARALGAATRADSIAVRGFLADDCEWVDAYRDALHDLRVRASIAESTAHLAAGAAGRAIEAARRAVELDGVKEAAYRQLMLALAGAGERAEALRVWERCRITLVEELGVDPSPETEAVYLGLLEASPAGSTTTAARTSTELPSGVVTFLLTDIVESSALWEEHAAAMAAALERHDAIVGTVVATHGGTLLKSKLEGDATVSVFARTTECAVAALALLDAIESEPWPEGASPRLRMAMHTGEAFERGGDYFGPALNRAARLRGLAAPNEVLLSQAVAELVRDHLPDGVVLRDRGLQRLRGLSRGENVFELTRVPVDTHGGGLVAPAAEDLERPPVPVALTGTGPFVGRGDEIDRLADLWQSTAAGEPGAVFIGGEPGVGKSRLAGEIAQRAHAAGGLVLYGRCDEDLAAPLQPFIEAVRVLAPALGATRLRAVRGVDELTRMVPELIELLGEKPGVRADPDTERLALFDAVTQLLVAASNDAPVLLVLDDLHWAGKTTLSLLRHILRGAKESHLLVVGTYRDTELARTHPLAETLADLRRDTHPHRIALGGLAKADVDAYLAAIGNTDRALGRELAEITAGNPFFLIEVVRHVEESGGSWQPGSLPEGVREATGRRLSRLSEQANEALAVAAVVGATFDLALVEEVRGSELVDPIAEAVAAGLVIEEPGSLARFRFAHAIVRQVLLSELVSLKRVRLHRTIAELLEAAPPAADPDERLADLAYHWFECASAGSADHAVEACRRAADRAMERLAYEEAGDLYGMALQALEWVDGADDIAASLHLARCDALLTAGDVAGAGVAIDALELAAVGSERLAAWYTTYEGLLAVLGEPERLTEIVESIGAAAGAMRDVGDLTGEAKARYVHASALERLGRIGAAERALDAALGAARSSGDRRLADAILAEAAPAALWGPSPVTRASGRCLDLVRVLRITSGTPAVEAVALRCQAVLEALRGRMDAARRMIGSSRRTVEQLGLTHRQLETELAAGLIELLDGEATASEAYLRVAYAGLRERGLDGDAAQAGAFLGRALLLQDRIDEADEVATEASALAGSDLKAGITWRDVRAVVAARRGDTDRALVLAHEAVELASATDALLLVADARLTLAGVLRQAGDDDGADAEARRAVEACEAKGATVLAALARDAMGTAIPVPPPPEALLEGIVGDAPEPNLAMAYAVRFQEAFNRADWDAVRADLSPTTKVDDRRLVVGMTVFGYIEEQNHDIHAGGVRFEPPELLATRGDRIALCRWLLRGPGMEVPYLAIARVDSDGRVTDYVMFEPEAMDDAVAALDEMAAVDEFENDAARALRRVGRLFAARDWDAFVATLADDWYLDDRRAIVGGVFDRDQSLASCRIIFDGGGQLTPKILATRGRSLALARMTLHLPDLGAGDTVLVISSTDESGRGTRSVNLDPDDLDGAFAALDRLFLEGEGAAHAEVLALGASFIDGLARLDVTAVGDLLAPDFVARDRRTIGVPSTGRDEWLAGFDVASDLSGPSVPRVEHLTDLSATGGLWALTGTGDLVDGGPWEMSALLAIHVDEHHVVALDLFDMHDVEPARAALAAGPRRSVEWCENDATRNLARFHAAYHAHDWDTLADDYTHEERRSLMRLSVDRGEGARPTLEGALKADPVGNTAWRAALRQRDAFNQRDWQAYVDATDSGVVYVDQRRDLRLRVEGTAALDAIREAFEVDDFRYRRELLVTRGEHLAVTRDRAWFVVGSAGPSEIEILTLIESGPDGCVRSHTAFNVDDLDRALAALDARHAELGEPIGTMARRAVLALSEAYNHRDWQGVVDVLDPDYVIVDNRQGVRLQLEGSAAFDVHRSAFALDDFRDERAFVASRGDRLVLTRNRLWFVVGAAGPAEVEILELVECGPDGRILAATGFDPDDLDVAYVALDARHAELTADVASPHSAADSDWIENEAWRAHLRFRETSNRCDWEAFRDVLDPGMVYSDLRPGIRLSVVGDELLDAYRPMFEFGDFRLDCDLLATRGEHLALGRVRVWFEAGVAGPAEVETLSVIECGTEGRIVAITAFAADDLTAALDLLDARYVAQGGPDFAAMRRLFDARDWESFAALHAPDCTIADHRIAGWGDIDRDTFVDFQRSVVELAPDAHLWIDHTRLQGAVAISTGRAFGTQNGGPWEIAFATVGVAGPNGALQHFESYELSDLAIALRRFGELVAEHAGAAPDRGHL